MPTLAQPLAAPRLLAGHSGFRRYAWFVLAWNVVVVLWGAYVRASGSGAGCGSNWPTCNGAVIPRAPQIATIIEFTHRLTSSVALLAVAGLCFWAFRSFAKGHVVRQTAVLSVVFLLMEALLGAGLVLFEYVGKNASVGRAIYLSAHLVNTQLLLAVLTLTAWFAGHAESRRRSGPIAAALPLALVVSVTGAIAALGDTLFPVTSLAAGLQQDLSTTAHFLLRLRIFHPVLAVCSGMFFGLIAVSVLRSSPSVEGKRAAGSVALLVLLQLYAGVMNVILLAPVWLQIVHLLLANCLW
ncbi:MAG: COX15/CtaA family protein, partial [Acidobacteriota bacterium]|nr:COX15/CtaA family protein [Acidobacteriota bacterium]